VAGSPGALDELLELPVVDRLGDRVPAAVDLYELTAAPLSCQLDRLVELVVEPGRWADLPVDVVEQLAALATRRSSSFSSSVGS
jgi:hypothetical protein